MRTRVGLFLLITLFSCSAAMQPIPGVATTMEILKPGSGPTVSKGDTVTVHAKGTVAETSKVFWSTKDPGQKPFTYDAGVGAVITGASSRVYHRESRRLTPTRASSRSRSSQVGIKAVSAPEWAKSSN